MGVRDHGYYGYAFVVLRPCQIIALCAVVGMAGHFISDNRHAHISVPSQIVGTLVISCIALLWTLLSFTAYDDTHFPYYATSIVDLLLVIPFIVVAAVLGGPLGAVACSSLPSTGNDLLAIQVSGSAGATSSAAYMLFVGDNQTTCYAIMAVWGLTMALAIVFALSGFATGLLYLGQRRAAAASRPPLTSPVPQQQQQQQGSVALGGYAYPPTQYLNDRQIDPEAASRKWHEAEDDEDDYVEVKAAADAYSPSGRNLLPRPSIAPRLSTADARE